MKKSLISFVLMLATICLVYGQEEEIIDNGISASKLSQILSDLSFTSSLGAPAFNSVSLGEINVSYKLNSRISVGFSAMGSVGDCVEGYTNAEGQFVHIDDDQEDTDHDMDNDEDDGEESCDGEDVENLMGTATIKFSDKIPLFVQISGGLSVGNKRPVYSALIGYSHELFSNLGIMAGLRYSDILHKIPTDAVTLVSSSGFKAEIGINWNF